MKTKPKQNNEIIVIIEGTTGAIDGYLEFFFGAMVMAQVIIGRSNVFRVTKDGKSLLICKLRVKNPPLGHQGEKDFTNIDNYTPFSDDTPLKDEGE